MFSINGSLHILLKSAPIGMNQVRYMISEQREYASNARAIEFYNIQQLKMLLRRSSNHAMGGMGRY